MRAANLHKSWTFRGGHERKDVATRLSTGLMGTPMPTFFDSVEKPEDLWHLANYVRTLMSWSSHAQVSPGQATSGEPVP